MGVEDLCEVGVLLTCVSGTAEAPASLTITETRPPTDANVLGSLSPGIRHHQLSILFNTDNMPRSAAQRAARSKRRQTRPMFPFTKLPAELQLLVRPTRVPQ